MSTSSTLKRKLSTSLSTATSNTATAIASSSCSSSSSSSSSRSPSSSSSSSSPAPKRICLGDNAAAPESTSSVTGENVADHDDEDREDLWAAMEPKVWDNLGGAHDKREFSWKKKQLDLVAIFGPTTATMKKLKTLATGVNVELQRDRAIIMDGPSKKLDHLINFMQKMLVELGPSDKNYVMVTVVGSDAQSHLAALQQSIGGAGATVAAEKLHFSVCHTYGEWTAAEVGRLVQDIRTVLKQSTSPSIHDHFVCDNDAFFNGGRRMQVLGVSPKDEMSPIHKLIEMLQQGLQAHSDMNMEKTVHATIINRRNMKNIEADDLVLETVITPLRNKRNHDWLGSLEVEKVVASRFLKSLEKKHKQYYNLLGEEVMNKG